MKKLMIFLLCFLLTGCAAPQAVGSESSGSSGSAPSGSVSSPQAGDASSQTPAPDASQEGSSSASEEPAGSSSPSGSSSSSSGTGSDPLPQNKDQIIQELVSAMSVEEKVGQMFFVRCPETDQAAKVSQYKLGGYILFGRDFKDKTAQQVRDEIASYQASSGIPMLIGTDEEGGTVVRASSNPNLFPSREPSPQVLYAQGGLDAILQDARQKSVTLLDLGVNVNFAPVADVSTDPADFIYERALGQDAQTTADYVAQVVTAMGQERIGSVLKHFPGYGNNQDTHTGVAVDERPYETFETSDFLPFQAGIQAGADAVLVSHNIVTSMDESLPASLSPAVVTSLLREGLGFNGVVVTDDLTAQVDALVFDGVILTDDLAMDAVAQYAQDGSAAVLAVQAGNDMVLTTDFETQIPQVIAAVEDGTIPMEQIDQSVARVLSWKYDLGLLGY